MVGRECSSLRRRAKIARREVACEVVKIAGAEKDSVLTIATVACIIRGPFATAGHGPKIRTGDAVEVAS